MMVNNMNNNYRDDTYGNSPAIRNNNLTRRPMQGSMANDRFTVPAIEQITGESVMPTDTALVPLIPATTPETMTMRNPKNSQGYLQQHIGQKMRVEFLIGSDGALIDRTGVLVEVGESFIVLQLAQTDDLLMCDLYSIKFVTIFK